MTAKTLRFSQLSASRQTLVRRCQDVNYGQIQGVRVRGAEPIFDPVPVIVIDAKLDKEEPPRPETALVDFELRDEVRRLMSRLDELRDGTIQRIEVRAGIPRRVVLESQALGGLVARPRQAARSK